MKEKIRQFMYGRYGVDQFSRFLMVCGMACIVLYMLTRVSLFYYVTIIALIYSYFRMLSRNYQARRLENQKYLQIQQRVTGSVQRFLPTRSNDPNYRVYRCPGCGQKVRVPKGRGKISITCPKCSKQFIKKT